MDWGDKHEEIRDCTLQDIVKNDSVLGIIVPNTGGAINLWKEYKSYTYSSVF